METILNFRAVIVSDNVQSQGGGGDLLNRIMCRNHNITFGFTYSRLLHTESSCLSLFLFIILQFVFRSDSTHRHSSTIFRLKCAQSRTPFFTNQRYTESASTYTNHYFQTNGGNSQSEIHRHLHIQVKRKYKNNLQWTRIFFQQKQISLLTSLTSSISTNLTTSH